MAYEFRTKRRVEFGETDMAGIAHFSHFFRYMESTEHAFFRHLGLSVHAEYDGHLVSWPRVRAECEFLAPLRFEEEIEIWLTVREKLAKSITYAYRVLKEDGTLAARGTMTTVCAALDPAVGRMRAIPLPHIISQRIDAAPPEAIPRSDFETIA